MHGQVPKKIFGIKVQDWFISITNIVMFVIFSKIWNGERVLSKFLFLGFVILVNIFILCNSKSTGSKQSVKIKEVNDSELINLLKSDDSY